MIKTRTRALYSMTVDYTEYTPNTYTDQALYAFTHPHRLSPEDYAAYVVALELYAPKDCPLPTHLKEDEDFRVESPSTLKDLKDLKDLKKKDFGNHPGRIYKCPRDNCRKAYKNRNGLKV